MKELFNRFASNISESIYKYFSQNSGKMLLSANIIGILLSSFAQAGAVMVNKDYTKSQKKFLASHELIDGLLMVASIFLVTRPIQCLSKKLVKSGKLITKDMAKYLEENCLKDKRGDADFDITKEVKEIIQKIENSDKFIKASEMEKEQLLTKHKKMLNDYSIFEDSTSAIATTIGTITSFSFVSPYIRNQALSNISKYTNNQSLDNKNLYNKPYNNHFQKSLIRI
ncbi:hypothetical protein J6R97_05140 [bacterium]|nr:hypothetical protein [bacterium]